MVGGRYSKTALSSALLLGFRHIIHQIKAYDVCLSAHIFEILNIFRFLGKKILINFFHFYF